MKMSRTRKGERGWGLRVLGGVLVLALVVVLAAAIVGCGDDRHRRRARARPPPGAIKQGGVLKIGVAPGNVNFDPALFAGAVSDILLQQQIYEKLVTLGQDFTVQPTLATEWDSPDGKVWTLQAAERASSSATARTSPPTTSSTRWTGCAARSSARRWPTCTPTSRASSPTTRRHVTFTAQERRLGVPGLAHRLPHAHALQVGQGSGQGGRGHRPVRPRVHLGRGPRRPQEEPDLLGQGRRRQPAAVPGRDRLRLLARHRRSDLRPAGRFAQLGRRHLLRAEADRRGRAPSSRPRPPTPTTASSSRSASTRARASELAFRQAIMAGTDRQAIVDLVAPGVADPGNGTLVGPAYADVLPRRVGRRTTRRRPSSCSPTPASPTAWTSRSSRRPPTRCRPSPPRGRRR